MIPFIISGSLIILFLLIFLIFKLIKNKIIKLETKAKKSISNIDNALIKRYELLQELYDITKGYLGSEAFSIGEIIKNRNPLYNESVQNRNKTNNCIYKIEKKIKKIINNYPVLRSSERILNWYKKSDLVLKEFNEARDNYNNYVVNYNNYITKFPQRLCTDGRCLMTIFDEDDADEKKEEKNKTIIKEKKWKIVTSNNKYYW